jgi:hypothetical protein
MTRAAFVLRKQKGAPRKAGSAGCRGGGDKQTLQSQGVRLRVSAVASPSLVYSLHPWHNRGTSASHLRRSSAATVPGREVPCIPMSGTTREGHRMLPAETRQRASRHASRCTGPMRDACTPHRRPQTQHRRRRCKGGARGSGSGGGSARRVSCARCTRRARRVLKCRRGTRRLGPLCPLGLFSRVMRPSPLGSVRGQCER